MSDEERTIETAIPEMTPEIKFMIESQKQLKGASALLKDENRYWVMMKLFDPALLQWTTQLDSAHAEAMTRHDTLCESLKQLGGLTDEQAKPFMSIKEKMHDSYALHQIPRDRKSRKEVTDVLKDTIEHTVRSVGDKIRGK